MVAGLAKVQDKLGAGGYLSAFPTEWFDRLDARKNARPNLDADVSTSSSQVRVLVIRAEEDWAIAKECWKLLHVERRVEAEWRRSKEQTV